MELPELKWWKKGVPGKEELDVDSFRVWALALADKIKCGEQFGVFDCAYREKQYAPRVLIVCSNCFVRRELLRVGGRV